MAAAFHRAAIIGTGLIGGSFALALRKHFPETVVVGWDKPQVLEQALECNAIAQGITDLPVALAGADLVYVALPVGHTIELLPEIGRHAPRTALVTDACSTKRSVCDAAGESFKDNRALFLGGHPMAGKEISGIASADANFFAAQNTRWSALPEKQRTPHKWIHVSRIL